jgi:hypothetical protein
VTVEIAGSRTTVAVEASHYFTGDDWVTFWISDRIALPEPIARFARATVIAIDTSLICE